MERNHVGSRTHGYRIMRSHADNNIYNDVHNDKLMLYNTRTLPTPNYTSNTTSHYKLNTKVFNSVNKLPWSQFLPLITHNSTPTTLTFCLFRDIFFRHESRRMTDQIRPEDRRP